MPQVRKTETLTIDEQAFVVEKMSQNIRSMVGIMDEWRQEEADAQSRLLMVQAALRGLQNDIYNTVVNERKEAIQRMEAFAPVRPPAPAPVETVIVEGGAANE